jgi:hypothetical protein
MSTVEIIILAWGVALFVTVALWHAFITGGGRR